MAEEETTYDLGLSVDTTSPPNSRAFVAVLEGARSTVAPLRVGKPVTIGRSRSCSIRVDERAVSRLQATITLAEDGSVRVEDHESRNGTFVGEERIEGSVVIGPTQTIRVGRVSMVVVVPRRDAPPKGPRAELGFVCEDPATEATVRILERAARKDATILLYGETGVGKEVMARFVHRMSPRHAGPFVALNCGSVPETLAESTLFGHDKGAFTGAHERHPGVFEQASGGTLFLDEVGELSPTSQTRLLRVLEERRVRRVGGKETVPVDVRLLAATHRDLEDEVRKGRFREDLLYRLDVVRVSIPPLRERPEDVLPLAEHFLSELSEDPSLHLDGKAKTRLREATWPGNVRQLRNAIQRAIALAPGNVISPEHLGEEALRAKGEPTGKLRHEVADTEREAIVAALESSGGNQTQAAKRLGIARRTLINKMEKHGLKEPPKPRGR